MIGWVTCDVNAIGRRGVLVTGVSSKIRVAVLPYSVQLRAALGRWGGSGATRVPLPGSATEAISRSAISVNWVRVRRRFLTRALVPLAGYLLAGGVAEPLYAQSGIDEAEAVDEAPAVASFRPRTIAVVPFVNISGAPTDDWLAAGIAETVTADLEQFGTLEIIDREALLDQETTYEAELAAGDEVVAREVARDLGVSWLVAGGFQHLGDQLRITARIVNVETGDVNETATVDGDIRDVFALEDRIVEELRDGFTSIASRTGAEPRAAAGQPIEAPLVDRRSRAVVGVPGLGSESDEDGSAFRAAPPPSAESLRDSVAPETVVTRGQRDRPGALPGRREGDTAAAGEVSGVTLEKVTGGLAIGDDQAQFGTATRAGALTGRETVRPTRTQTAPDVDGRLDDAVWRNAARITEFVQRRPLDGAPATEPTDVYIAYDSTNIYLGFHAHYSDPGTVRANRADRDQATNDDTFFVYFDPFLDQQRAYVFTVNGYGVQGDSILNARGGGPGGGGGRRPPGGGGGFRGGPGGAPRGDSSWDALFDTAGQRVDDGFTAEMSIPFKSLRYPQRSGDTPHRWGFQIARTIRDKNETVVWSPVSREVAGFLRQMGVLDGLTSLSTSRNIEILPTFTAVQFGSLDDTTGSFENKDSDPEGGVNFKYGVTSNLTADFTINPDFSQIESDRPQIEVNQRFALFFPELRPFFLEGAEIFAFPGPVTVVHTRTIADPLYGAKLTGKAGRTTVGLMYANDEAPGNLDDLADPAFGQSAQTLVGRVRYDLYSESHIGGIFTDREFLDSYSRVGGVDGSFRLGDTHSTGFRALTTQHRDLSGIETSGYMLDAFIRKSGRNLSYTFASYLLSPDFKTDVGFVRRTDQRRGFSNASYRWWPESWIISWGPRFNYSRSYNFAGILEDENLGTGVNFSFAKNISFNTSIDREMERFGGIDFHKTRSRFFGNIATSRRISFGGGFNRGDESFFDPENPYLGRESGLFSFINVRPISRLRSQININTSRFTDPRNQDELVFDVKIFRALTTYQFTERLLFRNISEYNNPRQDARFELSPDVPRERRDGILHRLRRSVSAG